MAELAVALRASPSSRPTTTSAPRSPPAASAAPRSWATPARSCAARGRLPVRPEHQPRRRQLRGDLLMAADSRRRAGGGRRARRPDRRPPAAPPRPLVRRGRAARRPPAGTGRARRERRARSRSGARPGSTWARCARPPGTPPSWARALGHEARRRCARRLPYERQGDEMLAVTPTPLRNLSQHRLEPWLCEELAVIGVDVATVRMDRRGPGPRRGDVDARRRRRGSTASAAAGCSPATAPAVPSGVGSESSPSDRIASRAS